LAILSKKFALNDFKEFTKIIFLSFKFIVILTIPVIFILYGRAEDIIYFIYGNSKISVNDLKILSNILRISAFSVIFHIASKVITSAFFASSNQRMSFIINISNLTLNAILVFALMKKFDIYAIFISNIFIAILNFIAMFTYLYRRKIIVKLLQKDLMIDIAVFSLIGLLAFVAMNCLFDINLKSKEFIFLRLSFFMIFYCIFAAIAFFIRRFGIFSKRTTP
jgi:peptidoglycan biosynthesis protein MviN/MurJ (putative lipid II flippase)